MDDRHVALIKLLLNKRTRVVQLFAHSIYPGERSCGALELSLIHLQTGKTLSCPKQELYITFLVSPLDYLCKSCTRLLNMTLTQLHISQADACKHGPPNTNSPI